MRKALSKLERVDSTAAPSASSASARLLVVSTPNSIAQCGEVFRRTRTPNDPACGTPGRSSAASSGTIRPARPNSALTELSSDAPSPKSHDGTARLGKIGLDVTIGGPAGGSERVPPLAACAATSPP
jgi:hypothetical protein